MADPARGRLRPLDVGFAALVAVLLLAMVVVGVARPARSPARLTLSPEAAGSGQPVTAVGTGFLPMEPVRLVAGTQMLGAGRAGPGGGFSIDLVIPAAVQVGSLEARGDGSRLRAVAPLALATIAANPRELFPRDTLAVTGAGFVPGEAVTIAIDQLNIRKPLADGNGSFATSFPLPLLPVPEGEALPVTVTATGASGRRAGQPIVARHPTLIVSTEVVLIAGAGRARHDLDADTGDVVIGGGDLGLGVDLARQTGTLEPTGGARAALVGQGRPAGLEGCVGRAFSTAPIDADRMDPGDYVCLITSEGRMSRVQLLEVSPDAFGAVRVNLFVETWGP